ncbi:MAG: hypothetical protein ACKVPJ_06265 [Chitinophagales bacterium]
MKRIFVISFFIFCVTSVFAQGEVSIGGTTTPVEKLDVNGAIIIRGAATGTTAGTIQWDATDGFHDGRTSAGSWDHLENENRNDNGSYTSLTCGFSNYVSASTYTGTSTSASETPFASQFRDVKTQFLYLASDLVAGGLCSGTIDSIGFNVVAIGSPTTLNGFTIKIKNTSTTSLASTVWETGLTTVFSGALTISSPGLRDFYVGPSTFPGGWDGSSNLLIEICFDNTTSGSNATVDATMSGISYTCTRTQRSSASDAGCTTFGTFAAAGFTDTKRPVLYIKGNTTGPITGVSDYIIYDEGVVVGNPVLPFPYTHHGPGTLTAEAIYDENLLLSDYVFDAYFDGKVKAEDAEKHGDYQHYTIREMAEHIEDKRHLPTMVGREEWNRKGKPSVGKLSSQLWVTIETQAIYIKELHEKISSLESIINFSSNPLLDAYKYELEVIKNNTNLTTMEKTLKIEELENLISDITGKK